MTKPISNTTISPSLWPSRDNPESRVSIQVGPILIVEDIAAVRELLEVQLRLRGYGVVTARDGQEALERLATLHPAAVLRAVNAP